MIVEEQEQLTSIISAIGTWSKEQFGNQSGDNLILGRVAPLLGMIEEFGELESTEDIVEIKDAVADLVIFLFDYCERAKIPAQAVAEEFAVRGNEIEDGLTGFLHNSQESLQSLKRGLILALTKLANAELKRVQGIRGFSDNEKYYNTIKTAVKNIIFMLYGIWFIQNVKHGKKHGRLFDNIVQTWEKVSKRNWKKNKETGVSDIS